MLLAGCEIAFQDSDKPNVHVTTYKAYLTSLKDGLTEADLREYFSCFGDVESVDIVVNHETGKCRGFGFVSFSDYDSVDKIVRKYCFVSFIDYDSMDKIVPKYCLVSFSVCGFVDKIVRKLYC